MLNESIVLFILALIIALYVLKGIALTSLNKLMNGKATPLAWIPFANIYLLGKLTFNKIIGWVLIVWLISMMTIQVGVGGTVKSYSIIPSSIRGPLMIVYLLAQIFLIIYAFCKCSKIKKNSKEV